MRNNNVLIIAAVVGALLGLIAAGIFAIRPHAQPPAFAPSANPYARGIYADGIIESNQANGQNVNLYPEVAATVTQILVTEGQSVTRGTPLVVLDAGVQRATLEQLRAQADAAAGLLAQLRAQPRPEALAVATAQAEAAAAILRQLEDQLAKQQRSAQLDPRSVSKDALDNATHAVDVARANLAVAQRQRELTQAGAWSYDIRTQERQSVALARQADAAAALVEKYTLRAPIDGVVLSIGTTLGGLVSPQGAYSTYTQGQGPVLVMSGAQRTLAVRAFVDEVLIAQLPAAQRMRAQLTVRGSGTVIPLRFVRIQPYVTPKIELSDQRAERVDLRVLPVLFTFVPPKSEQLYPGQLVDVYIGQGAAQAAASVREAGKAAR